MTTANNTGPESDFGTCEGCDQPAVGIIHGDRPLCRPHMDLAERVQRQHEEWRASGMTTDDICNRLVGIYTPIVYGKEAPHAG